MEIHMEQCIQIWNKLHMRV